MALTHPGKIEYVDGNSGRVLEVMNVADVPESSRFVELADGPVPVVRVVATERGDQRTIRKYGPDGQVLEATVQYRQG